MSVSPVDRNLVGEDKDMQTVSVIIPITERHDDISDIYHGYKEALSGIRIPFEMIFVIDGEYGKAYRELKSLKDTGEKLTIIKHSRTFGESTAIMTGYKQSSGDFIMTLPPYHQIDESELSKLAECIHDCDMVVVRRWPRFDSRWNQYQTRAYHHLVKLLTKDIYNDIGCGVRLFKRSILDEINLYGDLHRFLPILAERQGFKVKEIDLRQSPKEKRIRTYPFGIYIRRAIDLLNVFFLIKFTRKPLRFFGLTGTVVLFLGLGLSFYLVIARIFFDVPLSDRPLFLIGILLLVLGLQIFAIGLIGEIVIFTHASEIKEYHIEEIIN